MVTAVARRELNRGFAIQDGLVPLGLFVKDAATEVMRLRIIGVAGESCGQRLQSAVGAAEIQVLARRACSARRRRAHHGGKKKKTPRQQCFSPQISPFTERL